MADTQKRAQLRQVRDSMTYEYERMNEELGAIGVSEDIVDTLAKNAEVRPKSTIDFVLKHFAEDLDSRSLASVKRCIGNLNKLAKKARPLRKALKIPASQALLNGIKQQ